MPFLNKYKIDSKIKRHKRNSNILTMSSIASLIAVINKTIESGAILVPGVNEVICGIN